MVGLEAAMLASAALAFTMFLWLLLYGRDRSRADYAAYADAHGWNHSNEAPLHLAQHAAELAGRQVSGSQCGPYFSGPSGAGPFKVMGIHGARQRLGGRAQAASWSGDCTFVQIRTASPCPGLRFGPRGAPVPLTSSEGAVDAVGHSEFARRFHVQSHDPGYVALTLDYEACSLLMKPERGVVCSWDGHDLHLMFPLRPTTMAGYETLLRYAVALTRRLEYHEGRGLPVGRRPRPVAAPAIGSAPVPAA